MRKEFIPYLTLVKFLAEALGPNSEIVLHDMTDLENSIIAIENGHISGRQTGGPSSDLVLKIEQDSRYQSVDYLCNYEGYTKAGNRLRSSTYFIRDNRQKIIGMLCINTDVNDLMRARDLLDSLIHTEFSEESRDISEKFIVNSDEMTMQQIQALIEGKGVTPGRMSQQEKIDIVKELNNIGLFRFKGAVSQAATALCVSEPTIYRYLNQIRKERNSISD